MTQLTLNISEGQKRIKQAADNNSFVLSLLRIHARKVSDERGSCCSDDLRKYANEEGLNVTTPKAWGAITNSIFRAKDGWIEVGRKQSEIEGNHARKISVFRLVK